MPGWAGQSVRAGRRQQAREEVGGQLPTARSHRNLEVVARAGDRLVFLWRDAAGWHGPDPLVADGVAVRGVTGNRSLIQSRFGPFGNFELVVPAVGGGCLHFWRENDHPTLPWHGPTRVDPLSQVDAVSLIQSSLGGGNLEVIARIDDQLALAWRDAGPAFRWSGFFAIPPG